MIKLLFILFVVVPVIWLLLILIFRMVAGMPAGDSQTLSEEHHNLSLVEDAGELQLLEMAREYPFGSKEQQAIMDQWKRLNQRNEAAKAQRRARIVDARMQGK